MTSFVFAGPTLPPGTLPACTDIVFLPPVARGDVLAICDRRPAAIGIIDGYFEAAPAVWHKEILWALSLGIPVFGAASMGALRAAELADFGMIGVGLIYQAYRSGELNDDDEVAVIHGPHDTGYIPVSEAMVNIRQTLAAATAAGVIAGPTATALADEAKTLFYAYRSFDSMLEGGQSRKLPENELRALRQWLPDGRIDQKRRDGLDMVAAMRAHVVGGMPVQAPNFRFQHTDAWAELRRQHRPVTADNTQRLDADALAAMAELRLEGQAYTEARLHALVRGLALALANAQGIGVTDALLAEAAARFCGAQGLREADDLDEWLREHGLTTSEFDRLLRAEAQIQPIMRLAEARIAGLLADYLRLSGRMASLVERGRRKARLLSKLEKDRTASNWPAVDDAALWRWYFVDVLKQDVPADLDSYAEALDFGRIDEMRASVRAEWQLAMAGEHTALEL